MCVAMKEASATRRRPVSVRAVGEEMEGSVRRRGRCVLRRVCRVE